MAPPSRALEVNDVGGAGERLGRYGLSICRADNPRERLVVGLVAHSSCLVLEGTLVALLPDLRVRSDICTRPFGGSNIGLWSRPERDDVAAGRGGGSRFFERRRPLVSGCSPPAPGLACEADPERGTRLAWRGSDAVDRAAHLSEEHAPWPFGTGLCGSTPAALTA